MAPEKTIVSFRLAFDIVEWLNFNADARGLTRTGFLEAILAKHRTDQEQAMSVTIQVLGPQGVPLPQHHHQGQVFLETPETGNYRIFMKNNSGQRRLVVLSVDGLNVVDGSVANTEGLGYVLDAFGSVEVTGWRRSATEVAAFEFKRVEGSYSAQMGHGTANTGVIGVAVFDEVRQEVLGEYPSSGSLTKGGAPRGGLLSAPSGVRYRSHVESGEEKTRGGLGATMDSHPAPNLGTGYGERTEMRTRTVSFERGPLLHVSSIRYGTRAKLIEWGVRLQEPELRKWEAAPNPFPAGPSVTPPPGWRG